MRLKAEDIVFFIGIILAIFVLLWLLYGSPSVENALISVGLFIITSEVLLWRKYFKIDKNVSIGFVKVKSDLNSLRKDMNVEFEKINDKLNNIKDLINKK